MEVYRIKVQRRRGWLVLALAAALLAEGAAGSYSYLVLSGKYADSWLHGFVLGIGFGLVLAVALLLVRSIVRCTKALKSEEALRRLYIHETDERTHLINDKVGGFGYTLALGSIAVAGAAASFIQPVVSVTLYGVLAYLSLVKAGLTLYYKQRL